jgi:D-alanyl-D-alanine carboxypeptidase (penicillin-binding protein 5/6)
MRTLTGLRAGAGLLLPLALLASGAWAQGPSALGGVRLATHGISVASDAPPLPATVASGWLVADMDTGAILAAKDPHGRYAPASTLKVLTAETLIPRLNPATRVAPTWDDVNVDGSKVGIVQQMSYSIHDLFTAMLVVSGNDAANTLATANGGVGRTVGQMNSEALRLNALDTHAVNANGLDNPRQLTSPYDLALIGRAAMTLPAFRSYVATKRYYLPAPGKKTIYLASHDKLLWNYNGAIGIKNGYTVKARATFVGAATRGGHTLIVTLLHTNPHYWPEAAALLNWGFAATAKSVQPIGQLVDPVPPPTPSASPAPHSNKPKVSAAAAAGGGLPVLPSLFVASGVAVLGGGVLRSRRRRPRRRLKLDLPV